MCGEESLFSVGSNCSKNWLSSERHTVFCGVIQSRRPLAASREGSTPLDDVRLQSNGYHVKVLIGSCVFGVRERVIRHL